jgi:hypothetical protein
MLYFGGTAQEILSQGTYIYRTKLYFFYLEIFRKKNPILYHVQILLKYG